MRVVVVLLLLANLSYAGWYFLAGQEAGSATMVRSPSRPAPQTLQLLSETAGTMPVSPPVCLEIRGFRNSEDSDGFVRTVRQMGYESELNPRQVADLPHFWVLMPPPVSPGEDEVVGLLLENAIDHYVISGGELDQGVSLGIFPTRESARMQQERVAKLGLVVEIREIQRSRTELRVELWAGDDMVTEAGPLQEYLDNRPELQVSEKLCETIAPQV